MADITIANMYFADRDEDGKTGFVPLGPLYLTAVLEQEGFQVDFRDYLVEGVKYDDPVKAESILAFLEGSADILACGCSSCTLPVVIHALEKLKLKNPRRTLILGGIGPTGVAGEILEHFPWIDLVIQGEGERTIVELMQRLESGRDLKDVKGIVYREGKEICINPRRERIRDLDELPFPAYHHIDLDNYTRTGLISARGCPFRCTFCDVAPFWGRDQYYTRSIGSVLEEVRLLKEEYHQEMVTLFDETFPISRRRVKEFCRGLKESKLNVRWTCSARISPMSEALLREMKEADCFMVFYGVESGSDRVLKQTKKGYTRQQAEQVIDTSLKYLFVNAFFMWGFPFETMADFHQTLAFVDQTAKKGVIPVVHIVNSLPLSELYIRYKDNLGFSPKLYEDSLLMRHPEIVALIESHPHIFPGFYHCDPLILEKYHIARQRGMAHNLITLDSLNQQYASYYAEGG
jgi:anaerobic magnesium-protoporphyrin IX monomethyl ester cyclase